MNNDEEFDDRDYDEPSKYRDLDKIEPSELFTSLSNLVFLQSDPFLRMQAFNLGMTDQFIMQMEYKVLRELWAEERTPELAHFLNAQSQMWILSAYELLRTWRESIKDILNLHRNGGLPNKIASLKAQELSESNIGVVSRVEQLEEVLTKPQLVDVMKAHLDHTYMSFTMLEFLRVNLAKNTNRKKPNLIPMLPHGRINKECGSLDFQLAVGINILGEMNRRDVADSIRGLDLSAPPPSEDDHKSFESWIRGPGQLPPF